MKLSRMLEKIQYARIQMPESEEEIEIQKLTCNSKEAVEKSLFVCIQGSQADGHDHIKEACDKGAGCILVEKLVSKGSVLKFPRDVAVILVKDTREALAQMSCTWFENPSHKLKVIGVTGTKGKSTVAVMIWKMLQHMGERCGLIGTIENDLGEEKVSSVNTTPDAFTIQKYFAKMVEAGCHYAVMEVSSQGIKQHRIDGIRFEAAVFTNFGEDHVGPGEHASMGEYRYYKSLLFDRCRIAIGNVDDAQCGYMFQRKCCRKYGFSCQKKSWIEKMAEGKAWLRKGHIISASDIRFFSEKGELKTEFYVEKERYELAIPGEFNVYNALAALQTVGCLGFDREKAGEVLKDFFISGRTERVAAGEELSCYIDYAHNAMSLAEVLRALRRYHPARILLVFGCGGNRAGSRRYEMGKIAGQMADLTILTSDNPRWEDPERIIDEIEEGIRRTAGAYKRISDRQEAICYAAGLIRQGDILLIAGKGHESYQEICGVRYPMDDRNLVCQAIAALQQERQKKEQIGCTQTLL